MNILNIINTKRFLITFLILLSISISIAYASLIPRDFERFMSLSTLGSNMLIDDYYPNPNAVVRLGDNVTWYLQVYNRMGNSEYIAIKIKILNSTDPIPDDNAHTPSPIKEVYEISHIVKNNQTLTIPLRWSIDAIERVDDYIVIKRMRINDQIINLDVRSINGDNFRFVIELWRYNPDNNNFEFSWRSNIDTRSAWNQIWFNIR
ncbi:MAG: hypothetical protein KatS3mg003_0656 [Candidatus Nitrosocaldaceae archaeon]|nr:MAG: hypothetical protein KatS3mg003_0656 [Candidatus Nitrosocaldaceae archaeon]